MSSSAARGSSLSRAATLGRADGAVTRDEALAHAGEIAAATELPVNADLEACFADDPAGVAETVKLATQVGIAGCSVEDYSGDSIYDTGLAAERVTAGAPRRRHPRFLGNRAARPQGRARCLRVTLHSTRSRAVSRWGEAALVEPIATITVAQEAVEQTPNVAMRR